MQHHPLPGATLSAAGVGTPTLAMDLQPGQWIRIIPHDVHGAPAGHTLAAQRGQARRQVDAEIDHVRAEGTHEIAVDCHPCYAAPGQLWCTTYHATDLVLVVLAAGRAGRAA